LPHRVADRQIAQIDRDQLDDIGHQHGAELGDVAPFEVHDAIVAAQPIEQLTDTGVDRVDAHGTTFEQRRREASRARADIECDPAGNRNAQHVEGV
jgi:hypothetical protein